MKQIMFVSYKMVEEDFADFVNLKTGLVKLKTGHYNPTCMNFDIQEQNSKMLRAKKKLKLNLFNGYIYYTFLLLVILEKITF